MQHVRHMQHVLCRSPCMGHRACTCACQQLRFIYSGRASQLPPPPARCLLPPPPGPTPPTLPRLRPRYVRLAAHSPQQDVQPDLPLACGWPLRRDAGAGGRRRSDDAAALLLLLVRAGSWRCPLHTITAVECEGGT